MRTLGWSGGRRGVEMLVAGVVLALLGGCGEGGRAPASSARALETVPLALVAVSNRADLISGGDALVEVTGPADMSGLAILLGPTDITGAFELRDNGRIIGLVTDMAEGRNELIATGAGGAEARLVIVNHPIGGPVFAGPQVQPWICRNDDFGLGPAQDTQCNTEPVYRYEYMSSTTGQFSDYDPQNPPSDIATTTTDQGHTAPFIVRIERGVIDRGVYDIAVLYQPGEPWTPWSPQPGWNGKVVWVFGSGGEPSHEQIAPPGVTSSTVSALGLRTELPLSMGYAVATTAMAHNSQGFNDVVQAEAVMMVKEHLVERYGEIRYTIGTGCSGGSMSQNSLASNYPGLLDGIMPACSYPDVLTTFTWFGDCKLLHRYFTETSPHLWNEAQRQAAMGHAAGTTCAIGSTRSESYNSPTGGSGCAGYEWTYDPETNPGGERCSVPDYAVAVFGRRPPEVWTDIEKQIGHGFANSPYDTTGIQWGLPALLAGTILPEQFVDLNEKVGGLDIDANFQPGRSEGDARGVEIAYRSGRFTHGWQLAKVPHLELRGSSNFEWHHDFQTVQLRNRLIRDNGHADQMVFWKSPGPLAPDPVMIDEAFLLMDRWLAAIEADGSDEPLEDKVLRHKPGQAVDACWFGGQKVTDQTLCQTLLPHFSAPRTAAGQPPTADHAKCHLKPLDRADYASIPMPFTDQQWARLEAAFPNGVCDYSRPGMFQQPPDGPWMTYAGGPGGVPLGPPPVSEPR